LDHRAPEEVETNPLAGSEMHKTTEWQVATAIECEELDTAIGGTTVWSHAMKDLAPHPAA
jgi:hypothetical protein